MGREKCEKYPKNKRNLLWFGGEIQNLGGELKALKKTLTESINNYQLYHNVFLRPGAHELTLRQIIPDDTV